VVIAIIALLVGILLPALSRARKNAIKVKDSTNVRSLVQAMNTWAPDNRGKFPLPSDADKANDVVAPPGGPAADQGAKNTTGAILSLMIYQNAITPEICVSPADSGAVQVSDNYEYSEPEGAVEPFRANWDPKFKGTPKDHLGNLAPSQMSQAAISNNSYAHIPVGGARRALWSNTVSSAQVVLGNRGPVYQNPGADPMDPNEPWELIPGIKGVDSETLAFFGPLNVWEGNIGFADTHVEYSKQPDPESATITVRDGADTYSVPDNVFFDEEYEGDNAPVQTRTNAVIRQYWNGIPLSAQFTNAILNGPQAQGGNQITWVDGDN
jgi:hypothetical protein